MLRRTTALMSLLALACAGTGTGTPEPSTPAVPAPAPHSTPASDGVASAAPSAVYAGQRPPWPLGAECTVPQPRDAAALYRLAVNAPSALEGGLLLCHITMSETPQKGRKWDLFGNPPDPSARFWVGSDDRGSACAQDRMSTTLSWPGVTLRPGDKMKLSVTDMDVNNNDFAGMDLLLFEGRLPVDLTGDHFSATCRGLSLEDASAQLSPQLQAAREQLRRTRQALVPQADEAHFGYPVELDEQARRSIEGVASYVGWEGAALDPLLEAYASMQADWMRSVGAVIATARASRPDWAEIQPGVTLSVTGHQCLRACVMEVTITNDSEVPTEVDLTGSTSRPGPFWAVLPSGRDEWLQIESPLEARGEPIALAAGESVVLQISEIVPNMSPKVTSVGPAGASLVRMIWRGQHRLLPVSE